MLTCAAFRNEEAFSGTKSEADEAAPVARALSQLSIGAACCGAPSPFGSTAAAVRSPSGSSRLQVPPPRASRFVLPRVWVVEPGEALREADVVVSGGRIEDVVTPGQAVLAGYDVVAELAGTFVSPGLIDMHTHLPADNVLKLTGLFLVLHLAHGVTGVRDAGDIDGTAIGEALRGLENGEYIGPRLAPALVFVGRGRARWPNTITMHDHKDAWTIARDLRARGAACMKLYENLTPADIAALELAAREEGLSTLGHVPTALGIEEAGVADAQHFFGVPPAASLPRDHVLDRTSHYAAVDARRIDVVVRAAVERSIANTPTLVLTERLFEAGSDGLGAHPSTALLPSFFRDVVWNPKIGLPAYRGPTSQRRERLRRALDVKLALVNRLHHAGAVLRLGTDVQQPFVVPGAALHDEMRLFVEAGVPARDVLRMATRDAALALGWTDHGTVRRGAVADLAVCAEDPSADVSALGSLRAVVRNGDLFATSDLRAAAARDVARRDRAFTKVATRVLARLAMWRLARSYTG